jgi:hypothetical protein
MVDGTDMPLDQLRNQCQSKGDRMSTQSSCEARELLTCTAYFVAGQATYAWCNTRLVEEAAIDVDAPGIGVCHTHWPYPPGTH